MTSRAPSDATPAAPDAAQSFTPTLYDVARDLRRDVERVELPLDVPGRAEAQASRTRLLDQLDQHLLPRLRELSAPAVVVVAGSTGAGKSTLYNSLLGAEVSPAGVLRPTTREPVYAHHPLDADVVPDAPVTQASRVVANDDVPRGIALLDAPDLDSLEDTNRSTARELLEGADLWLFVTTAARYGDALPWATLELATERGASVAMVLNRVPKDSLATIRGDLLKRLREHSMANAPLFVVPDLGPHEGLLEESAVAPVRRWLHLLAGSDRSSSIILRTLQGSLDALPGWVERLADAVQAQVEAAAAIRAAVGSLEPGLRDGARAAVLGGSAVGGEVSGAWAQLAHARTDAVKVKDGRARSTRRAGRGREAVLGGVLDGLATSVRHALESTAVTADDALRGTLTGPQAPVGGAVVAPAATAPERVGAREADAERRTGAWLAAGTAAREALRAGPAGDRAEAAVRAYGPRGVDALLLLAAAGLDDADRVLGRVLGADAVAQPVAALRAGLAEHAAATVSDTVGSVVRAVSGGPFDESAAAGLRLRRAELVRITRHARVVSAATRTDEGVA